MASDRRRTLAHLTVLVAGSLLSTWPALVHGAPDLSADGIEHARWSKAFSNQFWQGEWYPRWTSESNAGLGAPSFFFYPSMGNYGAALFRPLLAGHDPNGWFIAGWSAVLGGVIAAITAYFWLRDLTSPLAAVFGTVLYIISPYRLAIDFYSRGAIAEFWAFAWMPLVLLSTSRCVKGRRWAIPGLAVSYGLLAFTHLPTVLCFSWVVPLAVWMMSEPGERPRAFMRASAGIALGVGLAAVYVLPAMLDEGKSWIGTVSADSWFHYRNNFLFTKLVSPTEYKARVLILVVSLAVGGALFYLVIRRLETDARRRRLALLFLLMGAGALFMMTQLSIPIYEAFKILQKIQFPSRFAATLTIPMAGLAALAFPYLTRSTIPTRVLLGMLLLVWIGADAGSGAMEYSVWRTIPEKLASTYRKWTELEREYYSLWPRPADTRLSEPEALEPFLAAHPARSLVMDRAGGTAQVESWRPRQVAIRVHEPEDGRMTVGHFYYRDWRGQVEGSGQSVAVRPSPEGLIEVDTPRGDYTLLLTLVRDTPERAGIWISAVSLLLVCGLVIITSGGESSKS